jgi:hypothetical protein
MIPVRPTSRRPASPPSAGQSTQSASPDVARAPLFAVQVDRDRRIDRYIDYFGGGAERAVSMR